MTTLKYLFQELVCICCHETKRIQAFSTRIDPGYLRMKDAKKVHLVCMECEQHTEDHEEQWVPMFVETA